MPSRPWFLWSLLLVSGALLAVPGAASPQAAAASGDEAAFSQEQLEQMLAPIALYPDDLLSQILMACTYPLEIVQADRWAQANKQLKGDAAAKALEEQLWDASVKSLVAVPDVLSMLSEKLDWTQQLGDAFIAQPKQVLDTVQALRARAQAAGELESTENQAVTVEGQAPTQTIVIASASPEVIYVPVYDCHVVYGPWPYPSYPPYPYYPPRYTVGVAIAVGVAWGYAWGHCDWHGGDVDIDIDRNLDINRNIDRDFARNMSDLPGGKGSWRHDPAHRGSVGYRDAATAQRFGGASKAQTAQARDAARGRANAGGSALSGGARTGLTSARSTSGTSAARSSLSGSGTGRARSTPGVRSARSGALDGINRGGQQIRGDSQRGQASRGGMLSRGGSARGGGGRGGR